MALVIPGAPDQGGALASYLSTIETEIDWVPAGTFNLAPQLMNALKTDNDPSTWVAFAANALRVVWEAAPSEIRQQAQLAWRDVMDLGLARFKDVINDSTQAAVANAAEVLPFIGTIIKAVLQVVDGIRDYEKQIDEQNQLFSMQNLGAERYQTIRQYTHPDALVYQQMHVENYFDYNLKGNEWRNKPSYSRSSGAADRIFLGVSGLPDSGLCSNGVLMKCPSGSFFEWSDCRMKNSSDSYCVRRLGVSALFYPFWAPAYSDVPMIPTVGSVKLGNKIIQVEDSRLNPNALLASNQFALLSSPSVNLRVNAKRLLAMRDRFRNFFFTQAATFAPKGAKFGLLQIDSEGLAPGTAVEDRLTIDENMQPNYVPPASSANKFYIDNDGLIQPYPSSGADSTRWGVRVLRGPQTPQYAAISVAQYNAVVGSTLAFMSARVNFLRSGSLMKKLITDFGEKAFSSQVRSAMKYSANYGKDLPAPQMPVIKGQPAKPGRSPKRFVVSTRPVGQQTAASSGWTTGEKVLVGAGVAATGYVIWKRKFRRK